MAKPPPDPIVIETDVLIVGTGPAGASLASFLGYYGITGLIISKEPSTAPQPRAHLTNGATFECLRDIGLEKEFRDVALPNSYYGYYRFAQTLVGKDVFKVHSFGKVPSRLGHYYEATPCEHADISQNIGEPILMKYATQHGFHARFDVNFVKYTEDKKTGLVTSIVEDQMTKQKMHIVSRYLCGADGGGSQVAHQAGLTFNDHSSGGAALNVWYEADLTEQYRRNPGMLQFLTTPEIDPPAWGVVGSNRVVRPFTEFIMGVQAAPGVTSIDVQPDEVVRRVRQFLGSDDIDIKVKGIYRWRVNETYAETISKGNVFCLGDAIHKHPPANGLGSNTCIQDAYNLAWKLAYVIQGRAGTAILDSYSLERQPVGQRVVKIANDTVRVHRSFYETMGLLLPTVEERMHALSVLEEDSPQGAARRAALKAVVSRFEDETAGLGGEFNQRYASGAVYVDDEAASAPAWEEGSGGLRDYVISTYPGSRLPHAWLSRGPGAEEISTHDLAGHGEFTIFTGIGGKQGWSAAADAAMAALPIRIHVYGIGPGQDFQDPLYMWDNHREVDENGAVVVRPDRVVSWRSKDLAHAGKLTDVLRQTLSL